VPWNYPLLESKLELKDWWYPYGGAGVGA
jgi:hypothetical protein